MAELMATTGLLVKAGLCGLPLCAGLYAAAELAHRRRMPGASSLWLLAGRIALSVCLVSVLGGLLIYVME